MSTPTLPAPAAELLAHLRPGTLRALAAAIEARSPGDHLTASDLTAEGIERLGDILTQGQTPAVGLWIRYRKPIAEKADPHGDQFPPTDQEESP
jgi:hypothetical protein